MFGPRCARTGLRRPDDMSAVSRVLDILAGLGFSAAIQPSRSIGMMQRTLRLVMLAAVTLTGCSGPVIAPSQPSDPPANYRTQLANTSFVTQLRSQPSISSVFEITELTTAIAPQPGEWVACLRVWDAGMPVYYTFYFESGRIKDYRMSV